MDILVVGLLVLLFFGRWRWSQGSLGIDPLIFGSGKSVESRGDLLLILRRVFCSLVARGGAENRWTRWGGGRKELGEREREWLVPPLLSLGGATKGVSRELL